MSIRSPAGTGSPDEEHGQLGPVARVDNGEADYAASHQYTRPTVSP
jgi:hypothetical protein